MKYVFKWIVIILYYALIKCDVLFELIYLQIWLNEFIYNLVRHDFVFSWMK